MASSSSHKSRDSSEQMSATISFRDLYYIILERWWLVAGCLGLALVAAAVFILISPKLYTSTAVIEVAQSEEKVMNFQDVSQQNLASQDVLKTIEQNFHSNSVIESMVVRNKLGQDTDFLTSIGEDKPTDTRLVHLISGRSDAVLRKTTRLIDVTVDSEDPKMAQKLAGMFVEEAIRFRITQRTDSSAMATQFLNEEGEKQKAKLNQSELALQDYKEQFGSVALEDRQNTVTEKLRELNLSLTEVNSDRIRLESQVEEAKKNKDNPESLLTLAESTNDPAAHDLREKISDQEAVIGGLLQRYKEKNPKMIQARSQLKELNDSLRRLVSPERLQYAYESAVAKEKSFGDALNVLEKEALEINRKAIDYNVLKRQVETDQAMYEATTKRMQETNMAQSIESSDIRINEAPSLPLLPSKPRKLLILAVATVMGFSIGALLAFSFYLLNDSFKTVDQVESTLDIPVVGALPLEPEADEFNNEFEEDQLFVDTHTNSPLTEAFRSLRAALALLGREGNRKTFLFTSAVPEEGKSFVCANISAMFAQQELRTLVIDADLRKPRLSSVFGLGKAEKGLTTYLGSKKKLDELVVKSSRANLWILPAGPRVPNPSEILSGPGFGELMQEASKNYDRVVVDTSPIHAVSDTLLLVSLAQSVCLVIRAGKTPKKVVARAIELIGRSNVRPVGTIVNRLPKNRGQGYYYYYSHYEGYGDEGDDVRKPSRKGALSSALNKFKSQ